MVPGRHTLPWQQPKGHVDGLHGATHAWFWHVSPNIEQFWHWVPPPPHAVVLPPGTQVLPWQQPNGHVFGLQVPMPTHVWPWQVSPNGAQFWQMTPPVPHAVCVVPETHVLPWQQPLGQVVG